MTRHLLGFICMLALGVMPLAGCSETTGDGGSAGAGGGGAGGPGTLITAEKADPLPWFEGMNVWRVRYVSEATGGTPIEVSGVVVAPSEPLSQGSRDVVAYAHGTTGLFDICAPSNALVSEFFRDVTSHLIDAGYVVAATDYEGLGTPGIHPYHVGESEGRGVLDIIRAAAQIEEAQAGTRAVLWGESQGGHAALFGGEIAPNWAPEVELLGVISAAPFSEIDTVFEERLGDPIVRGISWQLTLAYEATYPELSLEDV